MNAKQILVAGCAFFCGAGVVSAASYQPFAPQGGLAITTLLPGVYADGTDGTLEQAARMADSSVQQDDVGSTVAPLDTHKMMSAPVSGDSSASPVLATATTTPRSQADRAADSPNVKDFGAKLDGSSTDQTAISSAFTGNKGTMLRIPGGTWPSQGWWPSNTGSTNFVRAEGYLNNPPNVSVTDYSINQGFPNFGPGVLSETHGAQYFSGNTIYSKVNPQGSETGGAAMIEYRQLNQGKSSTQDGNPTVGIVSASSPTSSGYMTGHFNKMFSMGNNYYEGFDVNHWSRTQVYGTNWAWDNLQEYAVVVPYDCPPSASADNTFCSQHLMNEMDYTGTVIEDDRTAYAPSHRRGTILGLGTGHLIAKAGFGVTWAANKTYHRYQMIIAYDANNKPYMFRALPKGYTVLQTDGDSVSGATQPTWTFTKDDVIEDGTVEWTCLGPYRLDIGAVISIMGGNDPANGWVERVGTYLAASNDYIYNAAFDMSEAQWDPGNKVHVVMRQQKDVYNDLTADGTAAGQNNHLTGYDSSQNAFTYKVQGNTVFKVGDDGTVTTASGMSFGQTSTAPVGLQIGSYTTKNPSYIDFFSGGNSGASARLLSNNGVFSILYAPVEVAQSLKVGGTIQMAQMTKAAITALPTPSEGMTAYDTDDHVQVTYRCPTGAANSCAWFQTEYGVALSN